MSSRYSGDEKALREKSDIRKNGKRRCTDCGGPTHNYRCERCWKKRRGFGFADSGDMPEIPTEKGVEAFRRAASEARQRREKPAPFRPDAFCR